MPRRPRPSPAFRSPRPPATRDLTSRRLGQRSRVAPKCRLKLSLVTESADRTTNVVTEASNTEEHAGGVAVAHGWRRVLAGVALIVFGVVFMVVA